MTLLDDIKKIKSTRKELRDFAIVFAVFFAVLTGLVYWRSHHVHFYFATFAIVFLGAGFFTPVLLKPFQKIWMILALLMGWVMSRVILGILFYLVLTPLGLFIRFSKNKFMESGFDPKAPTYWHLRDPSKTGKDTCEKQY